MKLIDIIQESSIKGGEQQVGEQIAALKGFLKGVTNLTIKSVKAAKPVLAKDLQAVFKAKSITGINKIDDLVVALGKGTLKGKALGDVTIGFMKTKGVSSNYIARLAPEFVNTAPFIKKYAKDGKKLTTASLKSSGYTDNAIKEILKASKGSNKFQNALKSSKSTLSKGKGTIPKKTLIKTTTNGVGQAAVSLGKKVVENSKKFITPIAKKPGGIIKLAAKGIFTLGRGILGLGLLKLLVICGVGYIGYNWWNRIVGKVPEFPSDSDLDATKKWMECIVNSLEGDERAQDIVIGESKNSIQYNIDSFGGEETGGHVIFYDDFSVKSKNGKTGKWNCETTKNLKEQSEGGVTSEMISGAITKLDDQLSGDMLDGDATDMKDAYKILKSFEGTTYNGKDSIQVIKNYYPKITGKQLSAHIGNLTNLDFTAIEYRDEMLKMIGSSPKKGGGSGKGDSDDKGGSEGNDNLNHLTIIWDKSEGGGGSKGSKYKQCDNFPLNLYCISDKIKEVQKCLNPTSNLKVDGYYGPLTLKAMRDNSLFADNKSDDSSITKVIYDRIIDNCNKSKDAIDKADGETVTRKKVEPVTKLEPIAIKLIKLDPEAMIDKHGLDKLMAQSKKRIDGIRIQSIIDTKLKFRGGKYILKLDSELTEDQLKAINAFMAAKRYTLDKKKETLKDQKYVWAAIDRSARRIERKNVSIDKIKSKNDEK